MAFELMSELAVSFVGGAVAGCATYLVQERQLKKEYALQDSAERVVHDLLSYKKWSLRSFKVIRHHLGGFDDKELRQLLVRCGAIRFMAGNGAELWGLLDRNRDRLGVTKIDESPANADDKELFK